MQEPRTAEFLSRASETPGLDHHPILVGKDKSTCMMLAAERGSEELVWEVIELSIISYQRI